MKKEQPEVPPQPQLPEIMPSQPEPPKVPSQPEVIPGKDPNPSTRPVEIPTQQGAE